MNPTIQTTRSKWSMFAALLLSTMLSACASGPSASESKDRLIKAQALFEQRCKNAGEKIYRTVADVEGIFLIKLRPAGVNYGDQFALTDPYGDDLGGDGYIESFIQGGYKPNHPGVPEGAQISPKGYSYVEAINPNDGKLYRYTGRIEEPWETNKSYLKGYLRFVLEKAPAAKINSRYGVDYEDISTHEDRDYWIAGSSLKVVDLQTNEVLAERVGYMMDMYQGNRAGGRSPWLFAADHACPAFTSAGKHGSSHQPRQADKFVEKILTPKIKLEK